MTKTIATLIVVLLVSSIAFAHGKEQHVMGTVTNISEQSITVETPKKEPKTIELNTATKFVKSGSPASQSDLKVGDRVVIHAKKNGQKLEAETVRFGKMQTKSATAHH